jgi:hypothetical protein
MEGSSSQLDSSNCTYRQSVSIAHRVTHTHNRRVRLCVPGNAENLDYQQHLIELLQIKRL